MRVHWTVFQHGDQHVEGQIWEPEQPTDKVILFCPGFPGMGAAHFEQRHAGTFVQAGFAVVVLRHCGTRLDSPTAPAMVNNAGRLKHGRDHSQTHLGGGPSTVKYWLNEPWIALQTLTNIYKNIYVWGSSFGALSSLWSLTTPGAPLKHVRQVLLVAGAQGMIDSNPASDILRIWKPAYMMVSKVTDKVSLVSAEDDHKSLEHAYKNLPERVKALPKDIHLTYLVVAHDELLALGDTERFKAAIGGRGEVVIDDLDKAYLENGLMAHDMPDYPTEKLLALIKE